MFHCLNAPIKHTHLVIPTRKKVLLDLFSVDWSIKKSLYHNLVLILYESILNNILVILKNLEENMRKLTTILLAVILCLSIVACGVDPTPTDVVNSYMDALKKNDTATISELYSGDTELSNFFNSTGVDTESLSEEFMSTIKEKLLAFEYTLSNEKIDGDKATVDVSVKTYNFKVAFTNAVSDYFQKALSMIFSDVSDEEMNKLMENTLSEHLNDATFDYEKTAQINLTKTEDGWKIDDFEDNTEIINTLTGGMIEFATEMSDAFSN